MRYYIGVDVGTGSARAGIFNERGESVSVYKKEITTWSYEEVFKEQSSEEIWENICFCVKKAVEISGINILDIRGIGFDATCSLVALDKEFKPVAVNRENSSERNVVLWMDHRANKEADEINKIGDQVLEYVGGKISLEMEIPKILWLKKNISENYEKIFHFFDLPDYLTYRATGKLTRSMCSLGCKWNYLNHDKSWSEEYLKKIGLEDIVENTYSALGREVAPVGDYLGNLSEESAIEMGLHSGVKVGVSMIDAHAGGIGILGIDDGEEINFNERIALIGGTSSCHMAVSKNQVKIPGIWGPYYEAMIPGYWLLEGGQSTTGALIDFMIKSHAAYPKLLELSEERKETVYEVLNSILKEITKNSDFQSDESNYDILTKNFHILPYFIGNRSPRSESDLRGMISGIGMDESLESLAIQYLATIQSIAYGTKHIIEEMNKKGFEIKKIFMTGGGTKNPIFLETHANITGCEIILGKESESVLLGAGILGAVADGLYKNIEQGMASMSKFGSKIIPNKNQKDYHEKKYKVFHEMYNDYIKYRKIMK